MKRERKLANGTYRTTSFSALSSFSATTRLVRPLKTKKWGGGQKIFKNGKRRFLHGTITYDTAKELAANLRF